MADKIKLSLTAKHQNIEVYNGRSRQRRTERRLTQGELNINPLTPELNPSAQRCLTGLFTVDFSS
jgi:hypothetical protein